MNLFLAHNRRSPARPRRAGVALVIVLAFVVLLTGLIVAYFSRSMAGRQLSNSSAGQTKAALLAQSASDIVVAGLKKEIAGGSTLTVVSPSANPSNVYTPLTNANAVPVRYPTPAPSPSPAVDLIPNLVRESLRNDNANASPPLPSPAVSSLASAVNSANDAALGGRRITPARWNSHYLIPRAAGIADTDSTPDATVKFNAPDWVLVTRNGPAVQTDLGTGATALNNAAPANANFVIGRYAYAIYDEGGLLDMNVAGYPKPATPAAATGFTPTQVSRKGSLALADLTQLPISSTATLSQSAVDSIVGWRNYAAANTPTGAYPAFTFSAGAAANWFTNFASNNTTGFLKVYSGAASATGPTDQALLSRQALLRLRGSIGFSANVLQYMGTFSRGLEQPSFIPAHIQYPDTAPGINNLGTAAMPSADNAEFYLGNNDAAGVSGSTAGQDIINPSFLAKRVTSSFTRLDGSRSVVGEPLVKRKFSLRRLSWITYKGPSAGNLTDPNVMAAISGMGGNPTDPTDPVYQLVAQGTADNIQKYFGLTWANGTWTYNHGSASIKTLDQVAALGREPDFLELLKASINVGSLAKGGPNLNKYSGPLLNYQYTIDTSVDYNVLQIAANLVDQFDADSYPTVIQVPVTPPIGTAYYRAFRGVEDLPYFYRYHPFTVVTRRPTPLLSSADQVNFVRLSNPTNEKPTVPDCRPANGMTSVPDPGEGVLLFVPDVWNPHDPNSTKGTAGTRPGQFRLTAMTLDPVGQTTPWDCGAKAHPQGYYDLIPPDASIPVARAPLGEGSTSFTFSDDGGRIYREPTLLWRDDAPTGSNLTPDPGSLAGPYQDVNTNVKYYGVCIGKTVLSFIAPVSSGAWTATPKDPNDLYLFQDSGSMEVTEKIYAGSYRQYTFRLQYKDPTSGAWITYDEKYPDLHGLTGPRIVLNPADWPANRWQNPYWSNQMNDCATSYDPRVARFGIGTANPLDMNNVVPVLEKAAADAYALYYNSSAGNAAMGASKYTVMTTIRPGTDKGNKVQYSNPGMVKDPGRNLQMRWYSGVGYSASNGVDSCPLWFSGLIGQNNPAVTLKAKDNTTNAQIYYEDADGVARRAMGAYADTSLNPMSSPDGLKGLPEAIASVYPSGYGVGTATMQSQSRPLILNRPFRSVAEMSHASRGGVWKHIDFFTPESGDTALLDTFCVNDPPADALVAGKVNLNTRQKPVLKAILAGSYRDEVSNMYVGSTPPAYALPALTATEVDNAARAVLNITTDTTNAWRGPFANIGEIVGRFIAAPAGAAGQSDAYTYLATASTGVPNPNKGYTFAGLSAALDNTVYSYANTAFNPADPSPSTAKIQRLRESAIRPLADTGQTRVWNLLIDVVAQTGRYPTNASALSQFSVDGEKRCWVHVAIDRFTGEVLDRQAEEVTE